MFLKSSLVCFLSVFVLLEASNYNLGFIKYSNWGCLAAIFDCFFLLWNIYKNKAFFIRYSFFFFMQYNIYIVCSTHTLDYLVQLWSKLDFEKPQSCLKVKAWCDVMFRYSACLQDITKNLQTKWYYSN